MLPTLSGKAGIFPINREIYGKGKERAPVRFLQPYGAAEPR
jgi:hypothetical protein